MQKDRLLSLRRRVFGIIQETPAVCGDLPSNFTPSEPLDESENNNEQIASNTEVDIKKAHIPASGET